MKLLSYSYKKIVLRVDKKRSLLIARARDYNNQVIQYINKANTIPSISREARSWSNKSMKLQCIVCSKLARSEAISGSWLMRDETNYITTLILCSFFGINLWRVGMKNYCFDTSHSTPRRVWDCRISARHQVVASIRSFLFSADHAWSYSHFFPPFICY